MSKQTSKENKNGKQKKEKEEDQARLNQMKSEIEELKKEIDNQ